MARTSIDVPREVARGEVVHIRTLIAHAMETGYRPGADGKILARDLIRRFSCRFDDGSRTELVFEAELFPAIAANPFIGFHFAASASGTLHFLWEGDNGFRQAESVAIRVG